MREKTSREILFKDLHLNESYSYTIYYRKNFNKGKKIKYKNIFNSYTLN